jgi:hypothetical protein
VSSTQFLLQAQSALDTKYNRQRGFDARIV